jgi:hypothetical protein
MNGVESKIFKRVAFHVANWYRTSPLPVREHALIFQRDLSRLVGALIGVAIGALLAVVLACAVFSTHAAAEITPTKAGLLDWVAQLHHRDFHDDRKKIFYLATLIFGGAFGLLGAWLRPAGDRFKVLSLLLLIGFVPVMNEIIRRSMDSDVLDAGMYTAFGVLVLAGIVAFLRYVPGLSVFHRLQLEPHPADMQSSAALKEPARTRVAAIEVLVAIAVIAEFVVPTNVAAVARTIGYEVHMCLYMIGPATYEFGKGLIPGIDYLTLYSIGTPWLFHYFLDPSIAKTMVNAVWFEVAEMAFFEVTLFFFLWWLLRSWEWALVLTIAILLTQFPTPDSLYAPSSTASRYPLMAVVGSGLVLWVKRDLAISASLLLALALAGSLFMNTETGIDASVAVAIAAVATGPSLIRSIRQVVLLSILTIIAFLLFSAAAFGPGVFDIRFLQYLIEPMLLFAGGYGSVPIDWAKGSAWVYNIVAPGLALASLAWAAIVARDPNWKPVRDRLAALAWVSLVGLLMSAKYINMSLVTVWQVNSWAFLIVLGWWAKTLIGFVRDRRLITRPFALNLRQALAGGVAAILVFLLFGFNGGPSALYAIDSYRTFPSLVTNLVNRVFGAKSAPCDPHRTGCSSTPIARKDVELIRRLTQPDARVAVFGLMDWVYLVEAQRASKFFELPSATILTRRGLDESVRNIDLIFLPRVPPETFGITHGDVAKVLVPQLQKDFKMIAEGADLLAWKRIR